MSDKTYYLRRVNKDNWAGISLYQFANEDIGAGVDDYGLPITGLTEDSYEENSKGNKQLVKGTRTLLEEAMSLEPGALKKGSTLKPNEFWVNYSVRLGAGEEKFHEAIPEDKLKIEFLKAQPQVAFGVKNIKAKTEYVLYTKEDEAVQSNKGKKSKREAYTLFEQLSLDEMAEILELLGIRAVTLSKDVIEDKLSDYMEEYPARFIAMVNDPNKKYRTFINKCLNKGILSIDGGAVVYNETILGYDTNSASLFLASDDGAKTYEALKIQLG